MTYLKDYFHWVLITGIVAFSIFAYEPFVWFLQGKIKSAKLVRFIEITIGLMLLSIIIFIVYFVYPQFFNWWNL